MIDPNIEHRIAEAQAMADRFAPELLRVQRHMSEAQAMVDRLAPELTWIRESTERANQFAGALEKWTAQLTSPFEKMVLEDRTWTYVQKMFDEQNRILAWAEQGRKDQLLISVELPRRGWYLSGQEPCTLSDRLAKAVRDEDWDRVDQQMMTALPIFEVDPLRKWLAQEGVPEHCINRLCRFLKHHDDGNYEEATYLGVPLLDEIAKFLYGGKAFTTKRSNRNRRDQSKPELAFKTVKGPDLTSYCESFVQAFGSLQKDSDPMMLTDENYWNRHAILHGLMERPMGAKDSAKCLMAINFLFFARRRDQIEERVGEAEEASSSDRTAPVSK